MQTISRHHNIPSLARSAIVARSVVESGKPPATGPGLSAHGDKTEACAKCPARGFGLCDSLREDELVQFRTMASDMRYADQEALFDQGEPDDGVQLVTSGVVRLYRTLPDGRRLVLGFALPGDFLGVLVGALRPYSGDALGPVSTCRVSRGDFEALVDANPRLMRRLHAEVSHELSLAQEQMVLLGRRTARERAAAFLVALRNRWKRVNGQSAHVALPMTRADIGDCLGLTVETVSRMFSAFAREKLLVIVPDGVRLLDFPRLEAIARG